LEPVLTANQVTDPFMEQTTFLLHFDNNYTNFGKFGQVPTAQWASQGISSVGSQNYNTLGTLTYSTSIYKFGGYSGSFSGGNGSTTGNVLTIGNNFGLPIVQGDFTMEMWVYPTANSSEMLIVGQRAAGGTSGFYLSIASGGNGLNFWVNNTTILNPAVTGLVPVNQWTSIAITRRQNTWYAFVNGINVQTNVNPTVTLTIPQLTNYIGSDNRPSPNKTIFQGYMDEFRFTTACRYTSNYRVQTAAFPNYSQAPNLTAPTDDNYGSVALLCHFEGTVNSTTATIVDSGPYNYTITRSETSGTTGTLEFVSSTAEGGGARFGSTSLALNTGYSPTSYGAFVLPSSQTPLNLTGDFCVEFWMGRNGQPSGGTSGSCMFSCGSTSLQCYTSGTGTTSAGQILNVLYNGSIIMSSTSCIMDDAWHAIAITRFGTIMRLFVDGNLQAQTTSNSSFNFSGSLWGRTSSSDINCVLIDELRISNGFGRYYTNYVPQRNAFANTGSSNIISTYSSTASGLGAATSPPLAGNATITIYGSGGYGGANLGTLPGGGGGQGAIATLTTTVSPSTTYYFTLSNGGQSYWGNTQVFGANSGFNGSPGNGGQGGTAYGSYTTAAAGIAGLVGNNIVQAGGAGGGPNGGNGQGPIPPNYTSDELVGEAGGVNSGGGGASNYNNDPIAGAGGPPQISITWKL
jgi:hypothetical protein